ncbi:MAG TPA: chemotaxis protein CheW [Gemmatimonadales bacterium]|nr:chemotaxis protein CheW [Gemmatimonadales bacterium]
MSRSDEGFLLVRAGNRRVGLQLSQVIEVTQLGQVHPVPSVEPALRGVVALQGRMVPVVNLGALLEGSACPERTEVLAVVVSLDDRRLCLEIEEAEILVRQPALPVPPGETLPWVIGVARHENGLVPLIDLSALGSRLMEAAST